MESVFLIYPSDDEQRVRSWLDTNAAPVLANRWNLPTAGEAVLYLSIGDLSERDGFEPADPANIATHVGPGAGLLQADVSRSAQPVDVRMLLVELLRVFPRARAQDDFSDHLWTLSEIAGGAKVAGKLFFQLPR
jgi:hypothetical protein